MNIKSAYNTWANSYDKDINLTSDLDAKIIRKEFNDKKFDSILEVGCGTGKNTIFLTEITNYLTAIDFSQNMILKAKEKVVNNKVTFLLADITQKWTVGDNNYNLVTFNLILEHIKDLDFIFSEAKRCLRTNGIVFINELHPFRQYEGKKAVYIENGETKEIDSYIHNISDFISSANKNGFRLLQLKEHWHNQDLNKLPRILSLLFIRD